MQLYAGLFNLALFKVCYSSLLHGMLYRFSTIYVLALIDLLEVQYFGCSQKLLKSTFVHRYSFIVAITSIRPKVLIPSCIFVGTHCNISATSHSPKEGEWKSFVWFEFYVNR